MLAVASVVEAVGALDGLQPLEGRTRRTGWHRRHGEADLAQPGWMPTLERSGDPGTNRVMRVWIDPVRGSRNCVPEGEGPWLASALGSRSLPGHTLQRFSHLGAELTHELASPDLTSQAVPLAGP